MTPKKLHAFTPRQAGQAGAHAKWVKVRRHKPVPVIKIPPSDVEILGGLVADGVPERGQCRWIEGEDDDCRWCARPTEGSWCCYHAARVYVAPGKVERVAMWKMDARS